MRGRVLIIVQNNSVPFDRRVWLEAKALTEASYKVSVICPKEGNSSSFEILDDIHIYRYRPAPQFRGALGYILEFTYCWIRTFILSLRILRNPGFDAIHACNPPDIFFLIGKIYKLLGKKFVYDQHDLCPELYLSRFSNSKAFLHNGLLFLEKMTYRTADVVISTNESYKKVALTRGNVLPENIFVVRNGPDLQRLRIVEADTTLKNGRRFLVCYLGIMAPQDGVEYLLRAANWLVNKKGRSDIHFILIGDGDSLKDLKDLACQLGLTKHVIFTGRITDGSLISSYLSTADVCASPEPSNPLNNLSTMIKVMEYMAIGKPVVAFDLLETCVSAQDAALYAKPNDVVDFAKKLAELLDDEQKRLTMGDLGRKRVEDSLMWEYSKPHLLKAYAHLRKS